MNAKADDRNDDDYDDGDEDIYLSILSFAKEGASKKDTAKILSISSQQLRRLTAELVDKGILHIGMKKKSVFITT